MLNTTILRYIVMVAEEKSISNAAKKLYITQPSLSQRIIALEQQLGVTLFDRSVSPLNLTYAGERFVDAAIQILNTERKITEELQSITQDVSGRIIIGISLFRNSTIIPRVLPIFRASFPKVSISLIEDTNDEVINMVMSGRTDLAFTTNQKHPELAYIKLSTDHVLLTLGREHPLAASYTSFKNYYPTINLDLLREDTFTLLSPSSNLRRITNRIFSDNDFTPKAIIETSSVELAHRMAVSNISDSFIFESILPLFSFDQQGLYYRFSKQYDVDLFICYRKNYALNKQMLSFIEITQQVLHQ